MRKKKEKYKHVGLLIWVAQIVASIINPEYIGIIAMLTIMCFILFEGVKK